jgi:hypothetical protein
MLVRLWKKPLLRIAVGCMLVAVLCALIPLERRHTINQREDADTLLPDGILLPDTVKSPPDTLLADTSGLGAFTDSLRRSASSGRSRFLRRHLSRGILVSSSLGDRHGLVLRLRDTRASRQLLALLATSLSRGTRLHRMGAAFVATAPTEDPDSCALEDSDLDGTCVPLHDTAARWLDSSGASHGRVGSSHVALISSTGGDSLGDLPVRVHPSAWKARSPGGSIGWIRSEALDPRDDPGLCVGIGRTRKGFRILSLEVCGEDD